MFQAPRRRQGRSEARSVMYATYPLNRNTHIYIRKYPAADPTSAARKTKKEHKNTKHTLRHKGSTPDPCAAAWPGGPNAPT